MPDWAVFAAAGSATVGNSSRVPRPVAYIAELLPPSAELIDKIHRKHNVTLDEVREAVILTDVESSVWDWHPDPARGWRLLVTAKTYVGRRLLVVLYPVDEAEGTQWLGTAMDDTDMTAADFRAARDRGTPTQVVKSREEFDAHSRRGGATFEVYEDRTGKFRFRLRASTGQVVATSEAYETKAAARRGAESVQLGRTAR